MSKRLSEELEFLGALAPVSVAAATATTTGYIDASETEEVCFLLSAASLASGKTIKATLMGSNAAAGTGAKAVSEEISFKASAAMTKVVIPISYKVRGDGYRYLAVKFQHDSADAVLFGVDAIRRARYQPADNAWRVEV